MENLVKSWFTTLLGAVIAGIAVYQYFISDTLDEREALVSIAVGFILMFMRDSVSNWFNQASQAAIEFFKNKWGTK